MPKAIENKRAMLQAENISCIPQRSPFRYPGGKTWLIPQICEWLASCGDNLRLVEPFAGGGIVSLTAVMEHWVTAATMIELDAEVAAVWRAILGNNGIALAARIEQFHFTKKNVTEILQSRPTRLRDKAFRTILENRVKRNGILNGGAGLLKKGEDGAGLRSRWYPDTLARRISEIRKLKDRITFQCGDGLEFMQKHTKENGLVYFIDPPYSPAGRRLYRHSSISHERVFQIACDLEGDFLITYNEADEIRGLATKYGFQTREIVMTGGVNNRRVELLIGRDLRWLGS